MEVRHAVTSNVKSVVGSQFATFARQIVRDAPVLTAVRYLFTARIELPTTEMRYGQANQIAVARLRGRARADQSVISATIQTATAIINVQRKIERPVVALQRTVHKVKMRHAHRIQIAVPLRARGQVPRHSVKHVLTKVEQTLTALRPGQTGVLRSQEPSGLTRLLRNNVMRLPAGQRHNRSKIIEAMYNVLRPIGTRVIHGAVSHARHPAVCSKQASVAVRPHK